MICNVRDLSTLKMSPFISSDPSQSHPQRIIRDRPRPFPESLLYPDPSRTIFTSSPRRYVLLVTRATQTSLLDTSPSSILRSHRPISLSSLPSFLRSGPHWLRLVLFFLNIPLMCTPLSPLPLLFHPLIWIPRTPDYYLSECPVKFLNLKMRSSVPFTESHSLPPYCTRLITLQLS